MEPCEAPLGLVETSRLPAAVRATLSGNKKPFAREPERIAVVEMAAVNGLALVPPEARDPWRTTSFGTGQLIRAAAELGAGFILLGIGGSATSDLGLGALAALGLEFRDASGSKLRPPFPAAWERIARIEGEVFSSIPPIAIACDVENPLLGPRGAAAIFGPQKGLRAADLARHDALAARMAELLCRHCDKETSALTTQPGTGAAGGLGFGLIVAARARLVPGFALVSEWLDLEARIAAADIVITGEGRFDATSLDGKGPGALVRRARELGRRAIVFAGAFDEKTTGAADFVAITPPDTPLARALAETERNLAAAVARKFPAQASDAT
jgi:glycerate kinase